MICDFAPALLHSDIGTCTILMIIRLREELNKDRDFDEVSKYLQDKWSFNQIYHEIILANPLFFFFNYVLLGEHQSISWLVWCTCTQMTEC